MPATAITSPDLSSSLPLVSITTGVGEDHDAVRRILASRHFAKAPLLSSFLSHVSRRSLEDGVARVSEYEIGVHVFQRSKDFDPRQDNIVRTYARHLRKRLQDYYEAEGQQEIVRVELPRGTYLPTFRRVGVAIADLDTIIPVAVEPIALQAELSVRERRSRNPRHVALIAVLLAACLFAAWSAMRAHGHLPAAARPATASNPLWAQLFRTDRDTFVIPADASFVILQQSNHRTFSLAEYLKWFSPEGADTHISMSYLKAQTYTSVLNLKIVSELERLPEAIPDRFMIRAAKDMRLDDLRDGNAILLGSIYSNPWDEVFSYKLNFRIVDHPGEGRFWIVNKRPLGTEPSVYKPTTTSITHKTYAVVAFVPNLSQTGRVLLVQGLDAAGTQAAAEMLLRGDASFVKTAMKDAGPGGSFEILLEVNSLDAHSHVTGSRVVASRLYK